MLNLGQEKKSAGWNICLSGIQSLISLSNFNSDKMWRTDEKSRRASFCDWIELFYMLFSLYISAVLLLDEVFTEDTGFGGLFRDLRAASSTENRKKHAWKLLKSSHQEKVNGFIMKTLWVFSPTGFLLPKSVSYGIMRYLRKSLHYKICSSALLIVYG